jgi:hypothetical protein
MATTVPAARMAIRVRLSCPTVGYGDGMGCFAAMRTRAAA